MSSSWRGARATETRDKKLISLFYYNNTIDRIIYKAATTVHHVERVKKLMIPIFVNQVISCLLEIFSANVVFPRPNRFKVMERSRGLKIN